MVAQEGEAAYWRLYSQVRNGEKKIIPLVLNHKLVLQVSVIFLLCKPNQLCLEIESMDNLTDHLSPTEEMKDRDPL